MSDKVTLVIEGFETLEQAQEFATWYSEQGEQDAWCWFEERDNLDGVVGMNSKADKTEGSTVTMTLEMVRDG